MHRGLQKIHIFLGKHTKPTHSIWHTLGKIPFSLPPTPCLDDMFTTVTATQLWKGWCKGINEKQAISNRKQMEKPSSSAKFKGFAEFKTERSELQKGMWKKKSWTRGWKLMLKYLLKPLECMNYMPLIFWTEFKLSIFLTLLQAMLPALVILQNIKPPLIYAAVKFSQTLRLFLLVTS